MERKFRRVGDPGVQLLGGVCAGIGYYFGWPVWIVRVLYVLLFFGVGTGFYLYVLLWIFVPKYDGVPKDFMQVTGD